jgi:superfamily I DNA/RNA helicase
MMNPTQYEPSPQQSIVYDWVENGTGNAMVIAVAGSGKTTTLIQSLVRMVRKAQSEGRIAKITFCAYNKKIADEIKEKVEALGLTQYVKVATFHSLGFGIWRRVAPGVKVENAETGSKADRILTELNVPDIYHSFVKKAMLYAKQRLFGFEINMLDGKAWLDMVDHFDLEEEIADESGDTPDDIDFHVRQAINWTVRSLKRSIAIAREIIDFEDMIYMPLVSNAYFWGQDWVLVDEAQDTNPARRAFAKKLLKPGGRAIFVGDPAQAIYGFTGADSSSLDNIKKQFGCTELPLTVTFRCPKSVVKIAQTWVKHIQAAEVAPEGEVLAINSSELVAQNLTEQDAILCRNNAPLVDLALQLIKRGIACHVEGREIGAQLCKLVTRWKSVRNLDQLVRRLETYRDHEVERLMSRGREMKAETIADTVDALLAIVTSMPNGSSLQNLQDKIFGMFQDTNGVKKTLTLSTIHKSKGREWNRVFWYGKNKYQPSKYARQSWQMMQETNLMYVAATRVMASLVMVAVPVRSI